jgi:hypothetical protein
MSGNLVCGKENTQHARGCGPREGEGLNVPEELTRGTEKIKDFDCPSDFARRKEKIKVSTSPGDFARGKEKIKVSTAPAISPAVRRR